MAKYKVEIEGDTITKTLTFMGKEFTEIWVEDGTCCSSCIEEEVMAAFPDLLDEHVKTIEQLTCMDEDEVLEAIVDLTYYEQGE